MPLPELSPAVVADLMVAAEDSALVEEETLRVRNILGQGLAPAARAHSGGPSLPAAQGPPMCQV